VKINMEDKVKEIIDFDDYKSTMFDKIRWWLQDLRYYPRNFNILLKEISILVQNVMLKL